jgi:hypothetical protein
MQACKRRELFALEERDGDSLREGIRALSEVLMATTATASFASVCAPVPRPKSKPNRCAPQ